MFNSLLDISRTEPQSQTCAARDNQEKKILKKKYVSRRYSQFHNFRLLGRSPTTFPVFFARLLYDYFAECKIGVNRASFLGS